MKHTTMKIGLGFSLALSTMLLASVAEGQTSSQPKDQSSLAEYARRIRKETGPAVKPKVFDNDNLPKDDKLSIVGQTPVAEAKPATAENADDKTASAANGKAAVDGKATGPAKTAAASEDDQIKKQAEWKSWKEKLSAQKDQVNMATRELDVTQREYQLRAAAMYADAGNRLRNSTQWDKEETNYKQQIAEKQKAVDEAKQKLEDMREEAHKAGVPSSMIE